MRYVLEVVWDGAPGWHIVGESDSIIEIDRMADDVAQWWQWQVLDVFQDGLNQRIRWGFPV